MSVAQNASQKGAFEGLKVLDFCWVGVGPITTKYLADNGAAVIRVESASRPDVLRSLGPFKGGKPGINNSQFAGDFNTSKLNLGVNLSKDQGRALIRRLIAWWQPDVVAESFTPGVMDRWGLGYEALKKLRDDIIFFSTCQQGQTGPNARFAGYGELAAAFSGFYQLTGWPDGDPGGLYGAYTDFINPPNALSALVAALEYRRRTGKGQRIDLAQFECAVHYLAPALLEYGISGRVVTRIGNRDPSYAPHGVYPCKPRASTATPGDLPHEGGHWCAIAVTTDSEWEALCRAIGDPELALDARFKTFEARKRSEDELDRTIAQWIARHEDREVMAMLQEVGVPAGVVQSQSDLWEDPQLKHWGHFRWLRHPEGDEVPFDGPQFHLSRTPPKLTSALPTIGQHNELILTDLAGMSPEEIADLVADGVLEFS